MSSVDEAPIADVSSASISRRTLKKIENDARDNVSPSAEQRKDLNNQDRLAMKKNRYYAYGFSS